MTSAACPPDIEMRRANPSMRYLWARWTEYILLFIFAFVLVFLSSNRFVNPYDEGIILTGASQMGRGLVIHRDFYANYGPAQFWLLSKFFDIFGADVLTEKAYDALIRAGLTLAAYIILRNHAGRAITWIATATLLTWLSAAGISGYPLYPALLLILCSTAMLVAPLSEDGYRPISFACGILTGCAFLFKYDVGMYGILGQIAVIFFTAIFIRKERERLSRHTLLTSANYIAGVAIPIAFWLAYLQAHGALQGFIHDIFEFSAKNYSQTRGLPMPSLTEIVSMVDFPRLSIYMPLLIIAASVLFLLGSRLEEASTKPYREHYLLSLALCFLTIVFFMRGMVRASVEHMQIALIPSILLLALCCNSTGGKKTHRFLAISLSSILLVSTTSFAAVKLRSYIPVWTKILAGSSQAEGFFLLYEQRAEALQFLRDHTTYDDTLFVGAGRHDKIFSNDISVYFLSQRQPATHWYQFDPGLQNSLFIQEKMVHDLDTNKPKFVWSETSWDEVREPNMSAISSGVFLLDNYIEAHYVPVATFGKITIKLRRELATDGLDTETPAPSLQKETRARRR